MLLNDPTISIVHNDLTATNGFTLSAVMHNEMYFLPDFLAHYRKLGVERFILLDDKSDDGSFEFAAEQPDVMILKSDYRYGDQIGEPHHGPKTRAMLAWRQTILSKYCSNQWSLHLDLDEFIELPEGLTFPAFLSNVNSSTPAVIFGAMIDLYPKTWGEIMDDGQKPISDVKWFFDGRPHLRLRRKSDPKMIYSGARARLRSTFNIPCENEKLSHRIKRWLNGNPYQRMGTQIKPILINWGENFQFRSSHRIKHATSLPIILPIAHYKFAPNFAARVQFAIESGAYNNGSRGYRELRQLYEAMSAQNADFVDATSMPFYGFDSFKKAGIAIGIE